jgi:ABC-type uncharacterized transport system permease subunit|tara:strand:+ start:4262 stop:5080 length:819 start_codon:yes stop_codon:yes gene_type:complete
MDSIPFSYTALALAALAALLPVTVLLLRRPTPQPGGQFWLLFLVAVVGPTSFTFLLAQGQWHGGFGFNLWVTIAASLTIFLPIALWVDKAWLLTPLLFAYLLLLGLLALLLGFAPVQGDFQAVEGMTTWLGIHIAVSVVTYALATLAAVAGLAVMLQERALKNRRPTRFSRSLPSFADGERLQIVFLSSAELVLGAGLVSGMALSFLETGRLLVLDHKILLSFLAFLAIALLLVLQTRTGMRGQRAGRLLLAAYLLLTLAYPGVKFVSEVLM